VAEPYWASDDGDVTLYLGKCEKVLPDLPANSVDAIVTDPPAAVRFMGREWDSDRGGRRQWVAWLSGCMEAAARVLKPGGHLLVWSLPRTSHWTAWALEDAGLEIRDCILHLFGSGYPKSLDVSKAIDRQRNDRPDILRVTSWLADVADAKGIGRAQVDAHMGTSDMGGWWLSRLGHRCAVPTWEQWQQLRELLGFGDEMDAEVWRLNGRKGTPGEAWDQREVIGKARWDNSANLFLPGKDHTQRVHLDITAPATAEAARWEGFGTSLKPGQEMWWLARKPMAGRTVAQNVLTFGTGALNIDGCRVEGVPPSVPQWKSAGRSDNAALPADGRNGEMSQPHDAGRWPANVVFTHSAACDGRCAPDCPAGELDRQSGVSTSSSRPRRNTAEAHNRTASMGKSAADWITGGHDDAGGASRYFPVFRYQAKAPASERPRLEDGTAHETVKPLGFISWAARLITPPGGTVLDMFGGSGPVAEACIIEGFRCVIIEKDPKSADLIRKRLSKPIQPVMFGLDDGVVA
jgi:hypothetical protein